MPTWTLGGPTGLLKDDKPAGSPPCKDGYRRVWYEGKLQLVHRVVYQIAHGPIPEGLQVDHKDRNRDNNHPDNLRLATMSEQRQNAGLLSNNQTGVRGLCWNTQYNCWRGTIQVDGKRKQKNSKDREVVVAWLNAMREQLHPRRPECIPI